MYIHTCRPCRKSPTGPGGSWAQCILHEFVACLAKHAGAKAVSFVVSKVYILTVWYVIHTFTTTTYSIVSSITIIPVVGAVGVVSVLVCIAARAVVVISAAVADRVVVTVGAGVVAIVVASTAGATVCVALFVSDIAEPITSKPSNPIAHLAHLKTHLELQVGDRRLPGAKTRQYIYDETSILIF